MKQGRRWTAAEAESVLVKAHLEPLAPFKTDRTAWLCRCLLCGETLETTLHLVALRGYGCTYCSGKKIRPSDAESLLLSKNTRPLEGFPGASKPWRCECLKCGREVVTTYKEMRRPDRRGACKHCAGKVLDPTFVANVMSAAKFTPLEDFPGAMKPWSCLCQVCGTTSTPRFMNVQRGHGCLTCSSRRLGEQSRKVPDAQAVRERNLEPLEPYPGRAKPWKCRCLKCGREVSPTWGNLLFNGGDGCIKCGAALRGERQLRTDDDVRSLMIAAGYEPLEPYPGGANHWRCRCLKCGDIVNPRFGQIRSGYGGCRRCGDEKVAAATEAKKIPADEAAQFMRDAGYEPLEPYVRSSDPWKCRHEQCGQIVSPSYSTIKGGNGGCKTCADNGMDYTAPAILYLLSSPEMFSVKIGITATNSTNDRIAQHLRKGWELHQSWQVLNGFVAEDIEGSVIRYWRETLGAPPSVTRELMPQGGWTETASLLHVDLDEIVELVNNKLSSLADL